MRDFLLDGSRISGRVVRVTFDSASGHVTTEEVVQGAAYFNATPKGDYLYKSRAGIWRVGNARKSSFGTQVTPPGRDLEYESAALSPDGKLIVWSTLKDGASALAVTDARGVERCRIKAEPGIIRVPSWSPQSAMIAYYFGKPNVLQTDEFTLRVVAADGSQQKQIAKPSEPTGLTAERTHPPLWSPDGSRIMFIGNYQGANRVRAYAYVVQAGGAGLTQVEGGVWSTDGWHLLGVRRSHLPYGPFVLFVQDLSSGGIRDIAVGFELHASVANGRWSPDGRMYVFTADDNQVHLIDIERRKMTKLIDFASGAGITWLDPE
jgi:Tol biopolymer transport system component